MLGTTQLKKINSYPELRTTKSIEAVMAFVNSLHDKNGELVFPKGLNLRQMNRYYDKFAENFDVIKNNLFYSTQWKTTDVAFRGDKSGDKTVDNDDDTSEFNRILLITKPEQVEKILTKVYADIHTGVGIGINAFLIRCVRDLSI